MDIEGGLVIENSSYPFYTFGKAACEPTITHIFETIQGFLFAAYKQSPKL